MLAINIENLITLKCHIFLKKISDLSIVYSNCGHKYIQKMKKKIQLKY